MRGSLAVESDDVSPDEPDSCALLSAAHAGMKLLIVDDEPLNVILLEELLSEGGYHNFKSTTDPRKVLELCGDFQPDLILLDLMMPHLDGFAVMQQLAIPEDTCLPIIVLTADTTSKTRHRALAAGATDFLTKPFDHVEALLRVRNLLHARWQYLQLQNQNDTLEIKVRERTRELRETQQQVIQQERMRALALMASGVAHDFNNVLSVILGYGEIVLEKCQKLPGGESMSQDMRTLVVAAKDAAMMIDRLREFHRPNDSGEVRLPLDLNALVMQAIAQTQPRWKNQVLRNGATIRMDYGKLERVPPVAGDAAELREVLTNLIFNAVDAMPEGGLLDFKTHSEDGHVILQVSDTGTGMSEEVRQRCLEPFFTTKGDRGTGLGLAMVFGIIERHGGTLGIESVLGKGTTFTLRFPVTANEPESIQALMETSALPLQILFVDDEPAICEINAQQLAQDWHSVATARSGLEALEKFQLGKFNVVITDQAMPGMNGDQLVKAIKRFRPCTRVIMLTGFASVMDGCPEGVDLILSKPISHAELRQSIVKVMEPFAASAA